MSVKLIWADYAILAVLLFSAIVSAWRGFFKEVLSLLTWGAAFVVAFLFAEPASAVLTGYVDVPSMRIVLAFGGLFVLTLLVGGLVNSLVGQLIQKTGLSGTDRVVGIAFGLARGVALVTVLVLLAGLTPLPRDPWWQQSLLLPYFQDLAVWLRDLLPAGMSKYFAFS